MKILIIEDDIRNAELIRHGFSEQGVDALVANDGEEGKRLALSENFDIAVMDIMLPKINGVDLCREIKKIKPYLPILMLTALGATDDKLEGFDAGADDYMVKPFDFRELHARIKLLLKRNSSASAITGFILKVADLEMNLDTKIVKRQGKEISLTPKEFKLLEYMMRNSGKVLSRDEIAEKVWDTNFDTGTNFIDVYINYLRKKIDKDFNSKLIHTKPGMGFVFKEEGV